MTTPIHDSTTCTAGFRGQSCLMCHFAREFEKSRAKPPSDALGPENEQDEFLESGGKNVSDSPQAQNRGILEPDFDHEWNAAPRIHTRYTEKAEAEWWLMRGVWLGIQYERERGLVAMNGDLREMQRMARERVG